MDEQAVDFKTLLEGARQGDPDALRVLYERYSDSVRRVIRRRLPSRLRRRYDSTDFLQSVWTSFVQLPLNNYQFSRPQDLVSFLSRMASNKVIDAGRERQLAPGPGARETSLDWAADGQDRKRLSDELVGPTPTPSQVVMADERWEQLVARMPAGHRRVLELLRDGYSHGEISRDLGLHPKVLQRLLAKLREYTERT